jgi:hypothetical protein
MLVGERLQADAAAFEDDGAGIDHEGDRLTRNTHERIGDAKRERWIRGTGTTMRDRPVRDR